MCYASPLLSFKNETLGHKNAKALRAQEGFSPCLCALARVKMKRWGTKALSHESSGEQLSLISDRLLLDLALVIAEISKCSVFMHPLCLSASVTPC
jgi:hypothetical protein